MNDGPYLAKVAELLAALEGEHVPPWIKETVPRLSQVHNKLFVMIGEPNPALRADYLPPGIYPSNLLCELVTAVRAFEWPKVGVLVHDALSESRGFSEQSVGRTLLPSQHPENPESAPVDKPDMGHTGL
jgi:hypothetical protein